MLGERGLRQHNAAEALCAPVPAESEGEWDDIRAQERATAESQDVAAGERSGCQAPLEDESHAGCKGSTVGSNQSWLLLRVGGVYVASILASGIIFVWPVVQHHFASAGVFAEFCGSEAAAPGEDGTFSPCSAQDRRLSQVYLVGGNLYLVAAWPIGVMFDVWGARRTTVFGCVLCCAGGMALAFSVKMPSTATVLLLPGVVLCDVGSTMNSFALYGFLWHFHNKQGFLSGLANSTYSVSSVFPLIMFALFPFELALWILAALSAVAFVLCILWVPTSAEYLTTAEHALGYPFERPVFAPKSVLRSCYYVFVANYEDNTYFSVSLLFMFCSYQYYMAVLWPFTKALFASASDADLVAWAGSMVFGTLGFFLSPMVGHLADVLGIKGLIFSMIALNWAFAPFVFFPSLVLQLVGVVLSTVLALLQGTYYYRWFALYAPPDLFGNFQGAVCCACGLASLLVTVLMQAVFSGLATYIVPLAILFLLNLGSGFVLAYHILHTQMPIRPPVEKDEHGRYETTEGI